MSKDKYLCIFLKPNGCYCVYYPSNILFTRAHFLALFKRQRNSVSAQNIINLLKVFSFIHFNNLLGIKAKRADVNRKVQKLGNITWGISSDIPQFWLHHVTCLDQSRAKNIRWIIIIGIYASLLTFSVTPINTVTHTALRHAAHAF